MLPDEPQLNTLLTAVKNITEGNFEGPVKVDTRGIVGEIASYLNQTLQNLKTLDHSIGVNIEETPHTVSEVKLITEKTEQATLKVLDCADEILSILTNVKKSVSASEQDKAKNGNLKKNLTKIEELVFEIINSQEFQDVVQQRLRRITDSLEVFEQRLVDLVILFNISADPSHDRENVALLKNLHDDETNSADRQNLVDQLLAEFGI